MYLAKRVSESTYLEATIICEIVDTIISLNLNKAVGHNKIPAYFLKIVPFLISPFSADIN